MTPVQNLEAFIQRSKTAGQRDNRVRFHKHLAFAFPQIINQNCFGQVLVNALAVL